MPLSSTSGEWSTPSNNKGSARLAVRKLPAGPRAGVVRGGPSPGADVGRGSAQSVALVFRLGKERGKLFQHGLLGARQHVRRPPHLHACGIFGGRKWPGVSTPSTHVRRPPHLHAVRCLRVAQCKPVLARPVPTGRRRLPSSPARRGARTTSARRSRFRVSGRRGRGARGVGQGPG
jgi:hypothetical protein